MARPCMVRELLFVTPDSSTTLSEYIPTYSTLEYSEVSLYIERSVGLVHPEGGHVPIKRLAGDKFPGNCTYHGDCVEGLCNSIAISERKGISRGDLPKISDDDEVRKGKDQNNNKRYSNVFITYIHKKLAQYAIYLWRPFGEQ